MLYFLAQLPSAGLPQQTQSLPELPPGPSLDRVRGPVEIPFLETWQIVLIGLLSIIMVGLIGWKLFQVIRKQKSRSLRMSPSDIAIADLKAAATLSTDDNEQFAVLSSLALRRYFETGKGIHALGRTTDEFLKSLADHSMLNADARKSLAECLQNYDQVKFARKSLAEAERSKLTESALALIRHCEESTQAETDVPKAQS